MLIEETSTVTAKGQTTVPKAVRQALGVHAGDQITYRIGENGTVSLVRHEADSEEAAVDAFLAFLSRDIKRRPQAVKSMSEEMAEQLRSLTEGVEVDLDDDFSNTSGN